MAKKRKTKYQKKKSDLRHSVDYPTVQNLSVEPTPTPIQPSRQQFSYSSAAPTQSTSSGYSVSYVGRDLRKTLMTTSAIIVGQLLLAFVVHAI